MENRKFPFATALVTGASSGIGREMALQLGRAGVRVVVVARREPELQSLASEIAGVGSGGQASVLPADLSDHREAVRVARSGEELLGGLDLLIANAGVGSGGKGLADVPVEKIREILLVNTLAPMILIREALPGMMRRGRGHIVGISSLASYRGLPTSAIYSGSKAALSTFLETVRVEARACGVRVTDVHPGYVRTPMTAGRKIPMPFLMDADRAAGLILRAVVRGKAVYNFPWQMALLLRFVRLLPPSLYDRLLGVRHSQYNNSRRD